MSRDARPRTLQKPFSERNRVHWGAADLGHDGPDLADVRALRLVMESADNEVCVLAIQCIGSVGEACFP